MGRKSKQPFWPGLPTGPRYGDRNPTHGNRGPTRCGFRPRLELLEDRITPTHCTPIDAGDGLGPLFQGNGLLTITEDFSNNPAHQDPTTVSPGEDACEAQGERLFTHISTSGGTQLVPIGDADLPLSEVTPGRVHVREVFGTYEVEFRGIHPDFHVAAAKADFVFSGELGTVQYVGENGSLQVDVSNGFTWQDPLVTRGTPLGNGDDIGLLERIRFTGPFGVYIDNITILIDTDLVIVPNGPPSVGDDSITIPPGTNRVIIDVLANDTDPDGDAATAPNGDGDVLTITLPGGGATLKGGTAQVTPRGRAIEYMPPPNFPPAQSGNETIAELRAIRTDEFVYTLDDGNGHEVDGTVRVLVNTPPPGVNDKFPLAGDKLYVRPRGQQILSVSAADGLPVSDDLDTDGDPIIGFQIVTSPQFGSVKINDDGSFEYRSAIPNDAREDSFLYTYTDGLSPSSSGPAKVTIRTNNGAPVATGRQAYAPHGSFPFFSWKLASDPDGDPLEFELIRPPRNGTAGMQPDGTVTYSQPRGRDYIDWNTGVAHSGQVGFRGSDSFTYRVKDPTGLVSNTAVVEITVSNHRPLVGVTSSFGAETDLFVVPPVTVDELELRGTPLVGFSTVAQGELNLTLDYASADPSWETEFSVTGLEVSSGLVEIRFYQGQALVEPSSNLIASFQENISPGLLTGILSTAQVTEADLAGGFFSGNFEAFSEAVLNGDVHVIVNAAGVPGQLIGQIAGELSDFSEGVRFAAPGVLWNDLDNDGDTLSAVLDEPPENGEVDLREDGSFTYLPHPWFTGLDGFSYRAFDGIEFSREIDVSILVEPGTPLLEDDYYDGIPTLETTKDDEVVFRYPSVDSVLANDSYGILDVYGIANDNYTRKYGIRFSIGSYDPIEPNTFTGAGPATILEFPSTIPLSELQDGNSSILNELRLKVSERSAGQLSVDCFFGQSHSTYSLQRNGRFTNFASILAEFPADGDADGDGISNRDEGCGLEIRDVSVDQVLDISDGRSLALSVSEGTLADVTSSDDPAPIPPPADENFPIGFVGFEVRDLAPGGQTLVRIGLPDGIVIDSFYKYGPLPGFQVNHWYEFLYDGTTGAEFIDIDNDRDIEAILLHFVDGQRGDADLTANGIIVDPGGPSISKSSNLRFLFRVYQDLLFRTPETGGLNYWTQQLEQFGSTREQVAAQIARSQERHQVIVERMYWQHLNRAAEDEGKKFWVGLLQSGVPVPHIVEGFLSSPEYYDLADDGLVNGTGDDDKFLQALHPEALGRIIASDDLNAHLQSLQNGAKRYEIVDALLGSEEFRNQKVRDWFFDYLGRPVEETALSFWTNRLAAGARDWEIIAALLATEEYLI